MGSAFKTCTFYLVVNNELRLDKNECTSSASDGISPCSPKGTCFGNWYLPSLKELQLVKTNLYAKGLDVMTSGIYWTSTEANVNQAFTFDWSTGEASIIDKSSYEPRVRAIHAF